MRLRCWSDSRRRRFRCRWSRWKANPPAIPFGVPSQLLERRPDIAAAERLVAQANAQIGVAKAAYYPNVTLSAAGGFGNTSIANWFTWPSRFWSVGPSLAETLFDAGLRASDRAAIPAPYTTRRWPITGKRC